MNRIKVNPKKDKKRFEQTAKKTKVANVKHVNHARGGVRL